MLMLKFLSRRMFSPLPDFITSARRELMLSAVFLVFLVGAIVACQDCWMILNVLFAPAVVDGFLFSRLQSLCAGLACEVLGLL